MVRTGEGAVPGERQRYVRVREAPDGGALRAIGGTDERIIDAAFELFFMRGFKGTSMRDIAVACGLTAGALYNHFASKDALLYTMLKRVHDDLEHDLFAALESAGPDPRARLSALVRAHAVFHTRYRKDARVANAELMSVAEPGRGELVAARRRMRRAFEDVLNDGNATGAFSVGDVPVVAMAILNAGIQIASWFRPGGRLSEEDVAEIHGTLALRMAGATASTRRSRR